MTEHTTKLDAVGTNGCKVTTETLHAQPAAPPATTQYKFVNQTLYPCKAQPECLHDEYQYQTCYSCNPVVAPDTRHAEAEEPKAQDNPTWMDDCINVCSRHSVQFTKERDECFVCTNRSAHAPDVTALVEAADTSRLNWLEENEASLTTHREKLADGYTIWWNVVKHGRSISGHPLGNARAAIDAAIAAVQEKTEN